MHGLTHITALVPGSLMLGAIRADVNAEPLPSPEPGTQRLLDRVQGARVWTLQDGLSTLVNGLHHWLAQVRVTSRSLPPQRRSIRFRLAPRTYAPRGCIVRADGLAKSRKIPTRNCFTALGNEQAFNSTPMAVNPISSGSPHVRPMGRTCGEPDEIKKNTHPKSFTALFREQASSVRIRTGTMVTGVGRSTPGKVGLLSGKPACRRPIPLCYPNSRCKKGVLCHGWRER